MRQDMKDGSEWIYHNGTFENDEQDCRRLTICDHLKLPERKDTEAGVSSKVTWNNSIEFLMSCIAMSVGFGNIWRFPFVAYENGGGAFLIPYIILLFLVGKPFYFLEMIIGQFSGSSSVKVWTMLPAFMGIGWAQMCSTAFVATYYSSLMALTLYYLIASFSVELPWAKCREEWGKYCFDSSSKREDGVSSNFTEATIKRTFKYANNATSDMKYSSSAELYFLKEVLHEKDSIDDGIGLPDWKLTLCLLVSWFAICLVIFQGAKSTGRASYFLAIFPYVVLVALLIRAVTLNGAADGILFFISPKWDMLLKPEVWYAAITQCFFSLTVCFGTLICYSSHNEFRHNIYRDAMIITTLDTFTSFIAGCTIFGILGNLAYEMDTDDIGTIVKSGVGLAFISYPDAIAKFTFVPQLFSVLFFVMMFVLGIGSGVGMMSSVTFILKERFVKLKNWQIVITTCTFGFLASLVYATPGGQFILTLVDYYATSFITFTTAVFEIIGVIHIYGVENFMDDVEFMLNFRPSVFWRVCWFIVVPLLLIVIFFYTIATLSPLVYGDKDFPVSAHIAGVMVLCVGILQIPLWALLAIFTNRHLPTREMMRKAFRPTSKWGPGNVQDKKQWLLYKEEKKKVREARTEPRWLQVLSVVFRTNFK